MYIDARTALTPIHARTRGGECAPPRAPAAMPRTRRRTTRATWRRAMRTARRARTRRRRTLWATASRGLVLQAPGTAASPTRARPACSPRRRGGLPCLARSPPTPPWRGAPDRGSHGSRRRPCPQRRAAARRRAAGPSLLQARSRRLSSRSQEHAARGRSPLSRWRLRGRRAAVIDHRTRRARGPSRRRARRGAGSPARSLSRSEGHRAHQHGSLRRPHTAA